MRDEYESLVAWLNRPIEEVKPSYARSPFPSPLRDAVLQNVDLHGVAPYRQVARSFLAAIGSQGVRSDPFVVAMLTIPQMQVMRRNLVVSSKQDAEVLADLSQALDTLQARVRQEGTVLAPTRSLAPMVRKPEAGSPYAALTRLVEHLSTLLRTDLSSSQLPASMVANQEQQLAIFLMLGFLDEVRRRGMYAPTFSPLTFEGDAGYVAEEYPALFQQWILDWLDLLGSRLAAWGINAGSMDVGNVDPDWTPPDDEILTRRRSLGRGDAIRIDQQGKTQLDASWLPSDPPQPGARQAPAVSRSPWRDFSVLELMLCAYQEVRALVLSFPSRWGQPLPPMVEGKFDAVVRILQDSWDLIVDIQESRVSLQKTPELEKLALPLQDQVKEIRSRFYRDENRRTISYFGTHSGYDPRENRSAAPDSSTHSRTNSDHIAEYKLTAAIVAFAKGTLDFLRNHKGEAAIGFNMALTAAAESEQAWQNRTGGKRRLNEGDGSGIREQMDQRCRDRFPMLGHPHRGRKRGGKWRTPQSVAGPSEEWTPPSEEIVTSRRTLGKGDQIKIEHEAHHRTKIDSTWLPEQIHAAPQSMEHVKERPFSPLEMVVCALSWTEDDYERWRVRWSGSTQGTLVQKLTLLREGTLDLWNRNRKLLHDLQLRGSAGGAPSKEERKIRDRASYLLKKWRATDGIPLTLGTYPPAADWCALALMSSYAGIVRLLRYVVTDLRRAVGYSLDVAFAVGWPSAVMELLASPREEATARQEDLIRMQALEVSRSRFIECLRRFPMNVDTWLGALQRAADIEWKTTSGMSEPLLTYPEVIAQLGFRLAPGDALLGSGGNGTVWQLEDGNVLKLTDDVQEHLCVRSLLQDGPLSPRLARVYESGTIPDELRIAEPPNKRTGSWVGRYWYVREPIDDLPDDRETYVPLIEKIREELWLQDIELIDSGPLRNWGLRPGDPLPVFRDLACDFDPPSTTSGPEPHHPPSEVYSHEGTENLEAIHRRLLPSPRVVRTPETDWNCHPEMSEGQNTIIEARAQNPNHSASYWVQQILNRQWDEELMLQAEAIALDMFLPLIDLKRIMEDVERLAPEIQQSLPPSHSVRSWLPLNPPLGNQPVELTKKTMTALRETVEDLRDRLRDQPFVAKAWPHFSTNRDLNPPLVQRFGLPYWQEGRLSIDPETGSVTHYTDPIQHLKLVVLRLALLAKYLHDSVTHRSWVSVNVSDTVEELVQLASDPVYGRPDLGTPNRLLMCWWGEVQRRLAADHWRSTPGGWTPTRFDTSGSIPLVYEVGGAVYECDPKRADEIPDLDFYCKLYQQFREENADETWSAHLAGRWVQFYKAAAEKAGKPAYRGRDSADEGLGRWYGKEDGWRDLTHYLETGKWRTCGSAAMPSSYTDMLSHYPKCRPAGEAEKLARDPLRLRYAVYRKHVDLMRQRFKPGDASTDSDTDPPKEWDRERLELEVASLSKERSKLLSLIREEEEAGLHKGWR